MDPSTTLVTFMVHTPPSVNSVALVGSWDNFAEPYYMETDIRKGLWRGCHRFQNIICDGELDSSNEKRSGGLKMGGRYWYYYRLDGDIEYCDEREPCTTSCPLLPGQLVNILDVPTDTASVARYAYEDSPSTVISASKVKWTLNPADKFQNPQPVFTPCGTRLQSPPISPSATSHIAHHSASGRVKSGSVSPMSSHSVTFRDTRPISSKRSQDHASSPPLKFVSIREAFAKRPRSRVTDTSSPHEQRHFLRRRKHMQSRSLDLGPIPSLPLERTDGVRQAFSLPARCSPASSGAVSRSSAASTPRSHLIESLAVAFASLRRPTEGSVPRCMSAGETRDGLACSQANYRSALPSQCSNFTYLSTASRGVTAFSDGSQAEYQQDDDDDDDLDHNFQARFDGEPQPTGLSPPPSRKRPLTVAEIDGTAVSIPYATESRDEYSSRHLSLASSISSPRSQSSVSSTSTSPTASPAMSYSRQGDSRISYQWSMPSSSSPSEAEFSMTIEHETPSPPRDGGVVPRKPRARASPPRLSDIDSASKRMGMFFPVSGFQGYSLPEDQHASDATIRKTATPSLLGHEEDLSSMSFGERGPSDDAERDVTQGLSWGGQAQQEMVAMQDLHRDLGYLGGIIA